MVMLNINYGHNQELMEKCRRLREYSQFVFIVREQKKMYEDTIERLPDSKFFPYVCSEFERLWREVSTDYSDDKFVIQWK